MRLKKDDDDDTKKKLSEINSRQDWEIVEKMEAIMELLDGNLLKDAAFTAANRILAVNNAKEALWLITNSERTYGDLFHTIKQHQSNPKDYEWNMKIVIREWDDRIYLGNEFRSFVVNGNLTAISQYNDMCFYPHIANKENEIKQQIKEFFDKEIKDTLNKYYHAYVIDFVLISDKEIKVIELNPFGGMTGASLFSWQQERKLLQGGIDLWHDLQQEKKVPKQEGEKDEEEEKEEENKENKKEIDIVVRLIKQEKQQSPQESREKASVQVPILGEIVSLAVAARKKRKQQAPQQKKSQEPQKTCLIS